MSGLCGHLEEEFLCEAQGLEWKAVGIRHLVYCHKNTLPLGQVNMS